jgi:hypothetical protein
VKRFCSSVARAFVSSVTKKQYCNTLAFVTKKECCDTLVFVTKKEYCDTLAFIASDFGYSYDIFLSVTVTFHLQFWPKS